MAPDLILSRLKSGFTIAATWQQDLGSSGRVERSRMGKHRDDHTPLLVSAGLGGRGAGEEKTGSMNAMPGFS